MFMLSTVQDVSDKITDEDQLLGAQQKDQPKNEEEHEMDEQDDKKVGNGVRAHLSISYMMLL